MEKTAVEGIQIGKSPLILNQKGGRASAIDTMPIPTFPLKTHDTTRRIKSKGSNWDPTPRLYLQIESFEFDLNIQVNRQNPIANFFRRQADGSAKSYSKKIPSPWSRVKV
jgi:hypothetical protein